MQTGWLKDRNIIQWGGEVLYFMLILVIMLDPTNSVLHLKDVFFILLVGYNCAFYKPDLSYLPHIFGIYSIIMLSYIFGQMQGCVVDEEMLMGTIKGFAPLFLLLWSPYYDVIRLSKIPVLIVTTVIAILYVAVSSSEVIELFVWQFVKAHNEMIIMTHRSFLGVEIFGMYYKSIISFIFVLFIFYYKLYNEHRRKLLYLVVCAVMTFSFLISGTRSSMLLPFLMIALVMYRTFMKWPKMRYFFYPLLALFGVCIVGFILILATEKGETSNAMKYAHLTSYAMLFEENPLYLIFGQGPGAVFYSAGFGRWTSQTEWTYIELVRNYGILCVGILIVMFIPVYKLFKHRRHEIAFGMLGSYIVYLFVAGTNPLFVSSTGMIVLLSVYSFVYRIENKLEIKY